MVQAVGPSRMTRDERDHAGETPLHGESDVTGRVRGREAANSFATLAVVLLALLAGTGLLGGGFDRIVMLVAINMIAVVGMAVFTGNSGILTLGHVAFFAIGAYATGLVTTAPELKAAFLPGPPALLVDIHLGMWGGIATAAVVCLVLGILTGLPISRLRETSAIVATFGLLVICHFVLIGAKNVTNGNKAFYGVPEGTSIASVGAVLLVVLAVAFIFKESRYGLQLRAMRDNELAASAMGVPVNSRLLQAWVLSAVIVGVAGALFAHTLGAFSPRNFYLTETFAMIAMLIVGGIRSVSGAVLGTLLISALVEIMRPLESGFSLAGFDMPPIWGLTQIVLSSMILLVMYVRPAGLMGSGELTSRWGKALLPLFFGKADGPAPASAVRAAVDAAPGGKDLVVSAVEVGFGGLKALNDVSLRVSPGEVVGLIGPNGAGKTTLINAMTGVVRPSAGTVRLGADRLDGLTVAGRARAGLARTFQNIRLYRDLTVLENVMVSASAIGGGGALERDALGYLRELGLRPLASRKAGTLSYGNQRKLEIARALALRPRYLLLDEPAAGMNNKESAELLDLLRQVPGRFGVGILIIEHDLHLIMQLCDHIFVLNKGEIIASGKPAQIQADPQVIEAYLGPNYRQT